MDKRPSILIVDDELANFDVLEALLLREGYQIYYATNGIEALTFLQTTQPDLILLDVMMPRMDGMEACRRIKADPALSHIPIIMVTALTSKEDLAVCLGMGADDFISKPVSSLELSARVRSMLRIKYQYDDLQALLRLREDLVNMMVHDLRNPLASVVFSAEVLKIPDLTWEKQQHLVEKIAIAGQQLQWQIDSLLQMAKLESGKMVLNCIEVDLCALCTSALADFEPIAAQKNLTVVAQLPTVGGSLWVDVSMIRRVLDNLLANAIKFSPSRSQVVLTMKYLQDGGAMVQVIDSGPGIQESLKHKIFEKYETGNFYEEASQIGLGLAFCRLAIEAHGGTITATDNHPKGTIFSAIFPAKPPNL